VLNLSSEKNQFPFAAVPDGQGKRSISMDVSYNKLKEFDGSELME
jgi:hypothetical protein